MQALLANHLLGLLPVYAALTVAANAILSAQRLTWRPSLPWFAWVGTGLVVAVTYVPAHVFGFEGVLFWVAMVVTAVGTAVGQLR